MVLKADLSGPAVQHVIDHNTYNGLSAKMRLQAWSRV
jgi:hypothetical protein